LGSISAGCRSSIVQHFRSGQLKPIAVIADKRTALAPDIPTVEQGLLRGRRRSLFDVRARRHTGDIMTFLSDDLARSSAIPRSRARLMRAGFSLLIGRTSARIMRETAEPWRPMNG
jgi:tripartite-type tricarboxylate transporter receptor subunit TctC